jgi:hypothetical protein
MPLSILSLTKPILPWLIVLLVMTTSMNQKMLQLSRQMIMEVKSQILS